MNFYENQMVNCSGAGCNATGEMRFPVNIGGNIYFMPESQMYGIAGKLVEHQAKSQLKQAEIAQEYFCKEKLEEKKFFLKEMQMEKAEEMRQRRELITYGISENSEGFLCREMFSPEGKMKCVKPISKARNIALKVFFCSQDELNVRVYWITWEGQKEGILLLEERATPDAVSKEFAKRGFAIQTSREYKKNLNELVLAYLVHHAEWEELPYSFGWNRMSDGKWIFAAEDCTTMEEMLGYVRK